MFFLFNPSVLSGKESNTYSNNLHLKATGLFKYAWPLVITRHQNALTCVWCSGMYLYNSATLEAEFGNCVGSVRVNSRKDRTSQSSGT